MEIIIKDVNKHNKFLSELKVILQQYYYLPTEQISGQEINQLCEKYFNPDVPLYEPRPYTFLKSYIDVRKDIEHSNANFTITGYDFYTNDNYDVILVYHVNGEEVEKNYGNFIQVLKNCECSIAHISACCIENKIMEDNKLRKEFLIKQRYDLKQCEELNFSYEEWLQIYYSIKDALCERSNITDELICNRILSYLYTNNVLDLNEYNEFIIQK